MLELHPVARALLDRINSGPSPPIHKLSVPMARDAFRRMNQRFAFHSEGVGSIETYRCGPRDVLVRYYAPVPPIPVHRSVIAFVHGGGWVLGDLDDYDSFCSILANGSGCRVASIGYRLAPEHKLPAGLDDVSTALEWISANSPIRPSSVGLVAESAGAALACVALQLRRTPLPIRCTALIYPVTDLTWSHASHQEFGEGYLLTRPTLDWFRDHYLPVGTDPKDERVSPLYGGPIPGLRDAFVITAGYDPLRDEGRSFADKLQADGVDVSYRCQEDMIHGFITMGAVFGTAREALADVAEWMRFRLNGAK